MSIVTGFLGSGKTTLISRVLREPAFGRTAVIVNEFGEIGLDHELIAMSDDSVLTLSTGCLCCAVGADLPRTLMDLLERRQNGSADYERVLIETSGLSNPSAILQSMMTDSQVSCVYETPFVVTLVDATNGEGALRNYVEARNQVALADRLLISKTDLRAPSERLVAKLDALNLDASRRTTTLTTLPDLFGDPSVEAINARSARPAICLGHAAVETFTILRTQPMPGLALTLLLQAVAEHCGVRLLRLKGLVAIDEMPGRPMVIHGVGHVINAPQTLQHWPSDDHRTRIVLIVTAVPQYFVSRLLDAIEEEVLDATKRANQ